MMKLKILIQVIAASCFKSCGKDGCFEVEIKLFGQFAGFDDFEIFGVKDCEGETVEENGISQLEEAM